MHKLEVDCGRLDWNILVILLLPWPLLLISNDWIFNPVSLDSWLYHGYFHNFWQYLKVFEGTYYGTRLPWIIPGYICYSIFPPLVANYVLHLGFYYAAVFSLYFILKSLYSERAGLIAALLMGCYPLFLGAIGWDYVDGAGITYFLLTMLCLTLAGKSAKKEEAVPMAGYNVCRTIGLSPMRSTLLLLAGVAAATLIYTNAFLIIFAPVLLFYYLVVNTDRERKYLLLGLLLVGVGFVVLTGVLGMVNVAAGESFFFFMPSIEYGVNASSSPNPWKAANYEWIKSAIWLIYPAAIFILSLVYVVVNRVNGHNGATKWINLKSFMYSNVFSLCYIFIFLEMLAMEFLGNPVMQFNYYTTYLIPVMFLAVGAHLYKAVLQLSVRQYSVLAGCLLILLIVPLFPPVSRLFAGIYGMIYAFGLLPLFILSLSGMLLLQIRLKSTNLTYLILILSILFLSMANYRFTPQPGFQQVSQGERRETLFFIVEKCEAMIKPFNADGKLRFWYSSDEFGGIYASIASTHLWGYRLVAEQFPTLNSYEIRPGDKEQIKIAPGETIVILSGYEDALAEANAALKPLGLRAELLKTEKITQGKISFNLTVIRVVSY